MMLTHDDGDDDHKKKLFEFCFPLKFVDDAMTNIHTYTNSR